MTKVRFLCDCCSSPFMARTADRNRGWARFCSKRCKALKQAMGKSKQRYPWQQFHECQTTEDISEMLNDPYIIKPLYNSDGDRDGEEFFAGGQCWDHS